MNKKCSKCGKEMKYISSKQKIFGATIAKYKCECGYEKEAKIGLIYDEFNKLMDKVEKRIDN